MQKKKKRKKGNRSFFVWGGCARPLIQSFVFLRTDFTQLDVSEQDRLILEEVVASNYLHDAIESEEEMTKWLRKWCGDLTEEVLRDSDFECTVATVFVRGKNECFSRGTNSGQFHQKSLFFVSSPDGRTLRKHFQTSLSLSLKKLIQKIMKTCAL